MIKLLAVAFGGTIGSLLRYSAYKLMDKITKGPFLIGTITINLIGCLLVGFFWGLFEEISIPVEWRTFLFIGIFGAFTTFSTFGIETFNLFRAGDIKLGLLNILITNTIGIALVFGGFMLSRLIVNN